VRHAREIAADLIVMTTRGRSGIERLLLGSVADAVRRRAPCPVLIVPARAQLGEERVASYGWILLALDGSREAERALPHAAAFALRFQASVSVVRAVPPAASAGSSRGRGPHPIVMLAEHQITAAAYISRVADELRQSGVHVRSEPIEGAADDVLVRRARMLPADLVVLATRERGWIERLVLGSVTNGVLRKAICPVLIVPEHRKEDPRAA
jgi:nucleotide-binding universal stress UspA family protein